MEPLVALCGIGLEGVVARELGKLGLRALESRLGKVRFEADIRGCYRALMGLRAADRVLWEAASFSAPDFDALFEGVRDTPWERYIPPGMGLLVDKVRLGRSSGDSRLQSARSIQGLVHRAAAERLCRQYRCSRLPDGGEAAALRVYIEQGRAQVLLDLCGEPLFKRGYRPQGGAAPLRETTAAALILLSGWRRKYPLYDPFCGAGTILIEAALYAWNMAPGLGRSFALSKLGVSDPTAEAEVREDLRRRIDLTRTVRLAGSDTDFQILALAQANALRAYQAAKPPQGNGPPPLSLPAFQTRAMEDLRPSWAEPGFIITDPPYGKRLGDRQSAEAAYRNMAALGRFFSGWKLGVITDHPGFESHFGRKADACRELTNGAAPAYFYQYRNL